MWPLEVAFAAVILLFASIGLGFVIGIVRHNLGPDRGDA